MGRREDLIERRRASVPRITYPDLPVTARRDDLLAAIADHQVVVVAGETGSGKTTQLPKLCLELGRGVEGTIAHTQPRRLAARTVAQRIADELEVELGRQVGYSVRFTDRARPETLVRLMTDGLLLAEVQRDRLLRRYDTIIVDEAHERSLNIDFLLGVLHGLLPRRPDLKLIITSATIDPGRFAAHFGDAPVVEVSGRTYPVEVRHRPLAADEDAEPRDEVDAIGDAVEELEREGPGDVLVFLSGEREIRDTADVLAGRLEDRVDVLPLYARLSAAEQQRVFQADRSRSPRRRVVLATNVAETSVTVPGIRYVVDPGNARISRWSARLKVQRLPIEPVSQASADQRKGRCGRTSAGICIRLYDEEDFLERPPYTDPEILRTSLAAVILRMADLGLGAIEQFPFLDPPDRRQIRDGVLLLQELGALAKDGVTLTPLGRRLARLPVDPRMGRMVLEADRLRCASEVVVIAAALSIQDVRERPVEHRAQADELHARFRDDRSDFVAFLNLWRHVEETARAAPSRSQARKRLRGEHLNVLRVREWQDLVGQLRTAARDARVSFNDDAPAEADAIHQALLAGLLSHVGLRDAARREYQGARGARWAIFPGSGLAKKQPTWAMAAELVETSRLWGREVAAIDPRWIEPLAAHLVRRTYAEPRWDARRGAMVVTERVLLYGLPVVAGRAVPLARTDPAAARAGFVRHALVEGDWPAGEHHAFVAENARRIAEVEALEERVRRRGLLVSEERLAEFFDARLPEDVVSARHFDRWWRRTAERDPELLVFPRELLLAGDVDPGGRPDHWAQGELSLPLSYAFDPGSARDGVTVHVALRDLPRLRAEGFEWLVPAMRVELVTALLRGLPKELRRPLVPIPETAAKLAAQLDPDAGPLADALSAALERAGVRIPRAAWDLGALPAHLRMSFQVEDEEQHVLAVGQDLDAVREQVRPRLREALAAATRSLERTGMRTFDVERIPKAVALPGTGKAVRAWPALVDEQETVGVRVFEDRETQLAAMAAGTRRLLRLTCPSPARAVRAQLDQTRQLALAAAPHGSLAAVLDDATTAALDALVAEAGGPAWDAAAWAGLRAHVATGLVDRTLEVVAGMAAVLGAAREVERRLEGTVPTPLRPAYDDVAAQLGTLVRPGFAEVAGAARLPALLRYVRAMDRRLERLPSAVAVDRDRMGVVHELEALLAERLAALPAGRPVPERLREAPWLLEELRVSFFAQGLGVRTAAGGPVSVKRIRRLLDDAVAS